MSRVHDAEAKEPGQPIQPTRIRLSLPFTPHCWHCGLRIHQAYPCPHCKRPLYCSDTCEGADQLKHAEYCEISTSRRHLVVEVPRQYWFKHPPLRTSILGSIRHCFKNQHWHPDGLRFVDTMAWLKEDGEEDGSWDPATNHLAPETAELLMEMLWRGYNPQLMAPAGSLALGPDTDEDWKDFLPLLDLALNYGGRAVQEWAVHLADMSTADPTALRWLANRGVSIRPCLRYLSHEDYDTKRLYDAGIEAWWIAVDDGLRWSDVKDNAWICLNLRAQQVLGEVMLDRAQKWSDFWRLSGWAALFPLELVPLMRDYLYGADP